MPLRALINNNEVLAPFVSDAEWLTLKRQKTQVVLPCCNQAGYLRVSKLGIKHFVHKQKICDWKPESQEHLAAKTQIMKACREAGYEARTEVSGLDWRADVLATKENSKGEIIKIAFEVQWSYQAFEETQRRQVRYKENGIRCCWLFRKLPRGYSLEKPSAELPIFLLSSGIEVNNFAVAISQFFGRLPLREFVVELLTGKFKFCSHLCLSPSQKTRLIFFKIRCSFCGTWNCVYKTTFDFLLSQCKGSMREARGTCLSMKKVFSGINNASLVYLERLDQVPLAHWTETYSTTLWRNIICFRCFHCRKPITNNYIDATLSERLKTLIFVDDSRVEFTDGFICEVDYMLLREDIVCLFYPHWCYSVDRYFCSPVVNPRC